MTDFDKYLDDRREYFARKIRPDVLDAFDDLFTNTPTRQSQMADHLETRLQEFRDVLEELKARRSEFLEAGQDPGEQYVLRILDVVKLADQVIVKYRELKENAERRYRYLTATPTNTEAISARLQIEYPDLYYRIPKLLEHGFLEDCNTYFNFLGTQDLLGLILRKSMAGYADEMRTYFRCKHREVSTLRQAFKGKDTLPVNRYQELISLFPDMAEDEE